MESYDNLTYKLLNAQTPKELYDNALIMKLALEEVVEGKGAYDPDRLNHACNTIRDMQEVAQNALLSINKNKTT